jgi:formiminotetrahydrofolate cyclodeaminase
MVARLTVGKKKYAAVEPQMYELIEKAEVLRSNLTAAIQEDAAAFEQVMTAMKLPKATAEEQVARSTALEQATMEAIAVPLRTAAMATRAIELAIEAASSGNLNAISDAASGAALGRASLTGAGLNVRINCAGLQDEDRAADFIRQVAALEIRADRLENELKQILQERANLDI